MLSKKETDHLRDLAKKVKELSLSAKNVDVISRIKNINSLKRAKPTIVLFPPMQAVNEYMKDENLIVEDELFRGIEFGLKWKLCKASKLPDDTPVTDIIYTRFDLKVTNWMDGYKMVRMGHNLESSSFEPCILKYEDIKKIRQPELIVDWEKTNERFNRINEIFGDILTVVKGVPFTSTCGWGESMIDQFVEMRGLEQTYYDLVDAPEFVHEVMNFMTEAKLKLLEQYKEQNLLVLNNGENILGSSSFGFCDELPGDNFDPLRISEKNLWVFAQAQEFAHVSPEMLEEFVLPYQSKIVNKFGLSVYGCCEPIENKIDVIEKHIKNLRMISISPYTKHEKAAEKCKGKYVYAWKPQPAYITYFDEEMIEKEIRGTMDIIKDCCVSILLEDVYTYGNQVTRFNKWLDIARKVIDEYDWQN